MIRCEIYDNRELTYFGFRGASEAFEWSEAIMAFIRALGMSYRIPDWQDRIITYLEQDLNHKEYAIKITLDFNHLRDALARDKLHTLVVTSFVEKFRVESGRV